MEPVTLEPIALERAVEVVRALTTAEQQQRLAERLLAKGLLTHIPEGYPEGYVEPPPIIVLGEPVSETLLRERR